MSIQYRGEDHAVIPRNHPVTSYGTSTDVPDVDVGRISYYLKCCIIGCGINVDLPMQFLDYANAHRLPQEHQQQIFRLAFQMFRVEDLLNRFIFIDDGHLVLQEHTSNIFFTSRTSADMLTLARLAPSSTLANSTTAKMMICTSDWLNEYYVSPFDRYLHGRVDAFNGQLFCNNYDQIGRTSRKACTHHETTKKRLSGEMETEGSDDQQENIPMAVAVPLDKPVQNCDHAGASLFFVPGQLVRLCGLMCTAMNEQVAVVEHRVDDRVLVRMPSHPQSYSIRPENLIMLEGSISDDLLPLL